MAVQRKEQPELVAAIPPGSSCTCVKTTLVVLGALCIVGGLLSILAIYVPIDSLNVLTQVGISGAIGLICGGVVFLCIAAVVHRRDILRAREAVWQLRKDDEGVFVHAFPPLTFDDTILSKLPNREGYSTVGGYLEDIRLIQEHFGSVSIADCPLYTKERVSVCKQTILSGSDNECLDLKLEDLQKGSPLEVYNILDLLLRRFRGKEHLLDLNSCHNQEGTLGWLFQLDATEVIPQYIPYMTLEQIKALSCDGAAPVLASYLSLDRYGQTPFLDQFEAYLVPHLNITVVNALFAIAKHPWRLFLSLSDKQLIDPRFEVSSEGFTCGFSEDDLMSRELMRRIDLISNKQMAGELREMVSSGDSAEEVDSE